LFLISIGVRVAEVVRRAFAEKFGFGRKFLALFYAFAIEVWKFANMSKSDVFVAKTANTRMAKKNCMPIFALAKRLPTSATQINVKVV